MTDVNLIHRVSAATNSLEIAKAAHNANPTNMTFLLDVQKAKTEREAAIIALRRSFRIVRSNGIAV